MSWEGYEVTVCENAHIYTIDVYRDIGTKCPECGGVIRGKFTLEYTNGDKAEARANEKARKDAKKLADTIPRSNPEEVSRRIETLKRQKQQFLADIQDTLNKYDAEINKLRSMLCWMSC